MTQIPADGATPEMILGFWFPERLEDFDLEAYNAFWFSRMQGGMDAAICETMAEVTLAAARGAYDGWAKTPHGRLALILTLDQFPRSLWRDTPGAYGQDIKTTRLALEGIANGHFDALPHLFQKLFYAIAIGHCEGPDHLARMDMLVDLSERLRKDLSPKDAERHPNLGAQPQRVREIIRRFGRHPHRNAILGRVSTPEEEAYIAEGDFPHLARR